MEAVGFADRTARRAFLDQVCRDNEVIRNRIDELLKAHDEAGTVPDFEIGKPDPADLEVSKNRDVATPQPDSESGTVMFKGEGDKGGKKIDQKESAKAQTKEGSNQDSQNPTNVIPGLGQSPGKGPPLTWEEGDRGTHSNDETVWPAKGTGQHGEEIKPGRVIAHRYVLREILGEGGMGTVYLADQTEPVRRQVALKLIRPGLDSNSVQARFDAERQALALMDHPNIARVFDGGTTEYGQPFFVMEVVRGVPITDYCDQNRLPVRARLEIFVSVCLAVQHAHQKGIIHRDLKPGNVLVTEVDGRPTPKIIDFGVAKATEVKLTELSLSDSEMIVGTPNYMSPEQADPSSMDIDTRTDIYALGVILYELMAGSPPIDSKQFKRGAILEMLRMVRESDLPKPSTKVSTSDALPSIAANRNLEPGTLKRALQGDLDWIIMKALEKDRTRRYETAFGFASDVMRHLASEPVIAAPPSTAYKLKKFIRKNRGKVLAGGLLVVSLLAGIIGTSIGMVRAHRRWLEAEEARKLENEQYTRYRNTLNFALKDLSKPIESAIYTKNAQDEFARLFQDFVNKAAKSDGNQANDRARLGLLLGEAKRMSLQPGASADEVRAKYAEAIGLAETMEAGEERDPDLAAMNLEVACNSAGEFELANFQFGKAAELFSRSLAISRRVVQNPRTNEYTKAQLKGFVARDLHRLGWAMYQLNKQATEAIGMLGDSLNLYEEITSGNKLEKDQETEGLKNAAEVLANLALLQSRQKKDDLAFQNTEKAAAIRRSLLKAEPKNLLYKLELSRILGRLGDAFFFAGKLADARKNYDESLALTRELSTPEELLAIQRAHALNLYKSATASLKLGDRDLARKLFDECLAIREQLSRARPTDLNNSIGLMLTLARCGKIPEARTKAENVLKVANAQKKGSPVAGNLQIQSSSALAIASDNVDRDKPLEKWSANQLSERKALQDRSLEILGMAIESGFKDVYHLENDPDLDGIRRDPKFGEILKKMKSAPGSK